MVDGSIGNCYGNSKKICFRLLYDWMPGTITEKQKVRLAEQLNTSPEIIEILFPDISVAGKMIRILRDKFYLERLKDEAITSGRIELKRLFNYLDRKNYDTFSWQKILKLLKIGPVA